MMSELKGPPIYENWKAWKAGRKRTAGWEFPLYTDAHILGNTPEGLGPYVLFNNLCFNSSHSPRITLRLPYHLENVVSPTMTTTNIDNYFIGNIGNQFAALAGLCMGIRLKAADANREFATGFSEGDNLGRPIYLGDTYFVELPDKSRNQRLPNCIKDKNLNLMLQPLSSFPDLSESASSTLLRAAYLYQDGVWNAESDPNNAWIALVSAVEATANHWRKDKEPVMDRFETSHPVLLQTLREKGDDEWVKSIATYLDTYMGATKKFIDFVLSFLPSPLSERTEAWHQISWEPSKLKKVLSTIYSWRSKALHGGIPFPNPMFDPPWKSGDIVAEVPVGLASAAYGGQWVAKDTPMLLHTFEHIVRGSILKWWSHEATKARNPPPTTTEV